MAGKFHFSIDRGGTFTDIHAKCPNNEIKVLKLLSHDPANYSDAPTEGIRRIINEFEKMEKDVSKAPSLIPTNKIGTIRMGTTIATNALLERDGEKFALAVTKNFKDILYIGNQARPKIFDLAIECPSVFYEDVVEVEERIILLQEDENPSESLLKTTTGEKVKIWTPLNEIKLRSDLQAIYDKGIKCLAVALLHSYIYPDHEKQVENIAKSIGFKHVSLSSQIMPMARIVPRGFTACTDAYLTPCIKSYIENFLSGFQDKLKDVNVLFMQSDGGLAHKDKFYGSRAILSGPAGGVVGYAHTTYNTHTKQPVIGFDMGGTSTDVSRYDGEYEHIFESVIAGTTIQAPQLDINTVAAGGGSRLFFRSGLFVVGPESAGAHPGPLCYRKGGPLTVTDANLCLGRLLPEFFPSIFGPNENEPLDKKSTRDGFKKMTNEVNNFNSSSSEVSQELTLEEVAYGFIKVANETMCRPIRSLTEGKGLDTSLHVLACFGGAGGQHACSIARSLGMKTVYIHRYAGILSAYGLSLADVVYEVQEPCSFIYSSENFKQIEQRVEALKEKCKNELSNQGFAENQMNFQIYLHLRYEKTDCNLMCLPSSSSENATIYGDFKLTFMQRYQQEFGFTIPDRNIIIDDIRIRGIGQSSCNEYLEIEKASTETASHVKKTQCYFEGGYQETPVYLLSGLLAGNKMPGPAIIIDKNCTILVEPDCEAIICSNGDIKIEIGSRINNTVTTNLDAIQLSIFSHRFMSIAEQMGRVLQRTAISTNIKERLDFSCALFGPDGGLVSNAPHIPVHLGAMQETVRFQIKNLEDKIMPGDVLLANHPSAGGSHLPDLTVITPVFYGDISKPIFYVASRGHHADIGGISPGSMPSNSTSINQEGATFISFKLVNKGVFQEAELIEALMAPSQYPGSSGSRNIKDNIADLQAQVAANQKGIKLVKELIEFYGLEVVQSYMKHIQENAEVAVREFLKEVGTKQDVPLSAEDYMDDGTVIKLKVTIDNITGSAIMDFTGTGHEVYGNCNAPRAVSMSAIIYCLRCMVKHDIPLNQGCLNPIEVIFPKGSVLNPSPNAAVVGGNVLTSQRVVDVILKAFGICAASQGCMNNVTFGNEEMGYYETVGGGAGAGPNWHGHSGIHSHMTNTRITDPEILEKRYPVLVQKFELRPNSGGKGQFNGGDGIIRELYFRKNLQLSILTERRVFSPYGLRGGKDGEKGKNLILLNDGRTVYLGSKTTISVEPGDVFHMETPGGGGYGDSKTYEICPAISEPKFSEFQSSGSLALYSLAQESA